MQADAQLIPLTGERTEALGIIGALGLLTLFGVVIVRALRGRPAGRSGPLAVVAGIAFVFGTTGGFAQVLGVFGFTQLRAWSRISIVIAFCAFVAAGMAFDRLRARFRMHRYLAVAVAAVVVIVGLYDMTPRHVLPSYDDTAAEWASDAEFVHQIERTLGAKAAVFQMPVIPFPEYPPVGRMIDYDHLRGYLHSDTLSWSYGGVKGREADWQQRLATLPIGEQAEAIAEAGFDGLWFNRFGYGPELAQVEAELERGARTAGVHRHAPGGSLCSMYGRYAGVSSRSSAPTRSRNEARSLRTRPAFDSDPASAESRARPRARTRGRRVTRRRCACGRRTRAATTFAFASRSRPRSTASSTCTSTRPAFPALSASRRS